MNTNCTGTRLCTYSLYGCTQGRKTAFGIPDIFRDMQPFLKQSNHLPPCKKNLKLYIKTKVETQMDVLLPLQITFEEPLSF